MIITETWDFNTEQKYEFSSDIVIDSGKAKLKLNGSYPTNNPKIKPIKILTIKEFVKFLATVIASGSDTVAFTLEINKIEKYWDGGSWVNSSGFVQSNSAADINTNLGALDLAGNKHIRWIAYLHSNDGTTTPELDLVSLEVSLSSIVTAEDVFDFMGTQEDQRVKQLIAITNSISREQTYVEKITGRILYETDFSDILFQNNINCKILENKLILRGIYSDTLQIDTLIEGNETLIPIADFDDGNDYDFDKTLALITKLSSFWTRASFAIKISGKHGYGNWDGFNFTVEEDLSQAIIELVAAKSGMWRISVQGEDGDYETIVTTPKKSTYNLIKMHKRSEV